jgi:hypothetical protein
VGSLNVGKMGRDAVIGRTAEGLVDEPSEEVSAPVPSATGIDVAEGGASTPRGTPTTEFEDGGSKETGVGVATVGREAILSDDACEGNTGAIGASACGTIDIEETGIHGGIVATVLVA